MCGGGGNGACWACAVGPRWVKSREKNSLVHNTGAYAPFLRAVISYEKVDKAGCRAALQEIGLPAGQLHETYVEALHFAESVFG